MRLFSTPGVNLRDSEYKAWLQAQEYRDTTIATRLADARRVEQYYGDLDQAFEADGCASILAALAYSSKDRAEDRKNPTDIPIAGNPYNGLASYRSAVSAYCRFRVAEAKPALAEGLTREAVLAELARYDAAGSLDDYLTRFTGLGQPQTYWLVHGGRLYPSKAIVHGAVGAREAVHDGARCRQMLGALGFLVMDRRAYAELRAAFVRRMEPFVSFVEQDGPYWQIERSYKNELIAEARALAASDQTDAEVGEALARKLSQGKQGLPVNWMALDSLVKAGPELSGPAFAALGQLARTEVPGEDAMLEATAALEQARSAGVPNLALGNVIGIVASVRGTVRPDEACWFKITRIREAGRRLFGLDLFPAATVRAEDLAALGQMMRGLFDLLEREEGWQPADLFDVQGFLWVSLASAKEWGEDGQAEDPAIPVWLVTARWGNEDGFDRFIRNGEWSLLTDSGSNNNRRVREMAPGDRIVLRDYIPQATDLPFDANGKRVTAMRLRAIGTITENREDGLSVAVDWEPWQEPRTWYFYTHNEPVWRLLNPGERPSADRLRRFILDGEPQDYAAFLNDPFWRDRLFGDDPRKPEKAAVPEPTNLILHGPPGTGKTYRTAKEAVHLCDGEADYADTREGRAALMERYNDLSREGRIGFVTFHQSFSYEDFVEGLRPETAVDEEGDQGSGFRLEPRAGIFREIAALADQAGQARQRPARVASGFSLNGRRFWKMSLGAIGSEDSVYEGAIAGGYVVLGWGGDVDWSDPRFEDAAEVRKEWESVPRADNSPSNYTQLHPFRSKMKIGDLVVVPYGNSAFRAIGEVTGNYEFNPTGEATFNHRRPVKWLLVLDDPLPLDTIITGKFQMRTFYSIAENRVNAPALLRLVGADEQKVPATPDRQGAPDQFVLIIDEINRANVSKVFGELITLIEPDKRLGRANALSVRLPYSKQEFGVPANLHIIGTMNTADRSIALLDTALRRRFQFREIAPNADKLNDAAQRTGIDLPAVLTKMNDRIEYLIDRDHRIGHAFFINCRTEADVDAAMSDKVIPLLQEYFFEDWSRIAAVVGEGFIGKRVLPVPPGLDYGAPKDSWKVRDEFLDNRYAILLGKAKAADKSVQPANDENEGEGADGSEASIGE